MTKRILLLWITLSLAIFSTQAFQSTKLGAGSKSSLLFANNWYRQKLQAEYADRNTDAAVATTPTRGTTLESSQKSAQLKRLWTKTVSKTTGLAQKVKGVAAAVKAKVVTKRRTTTDESMLTPVVESVATTTVVKRKKVKAQPLSRRKEEKLAAKYASIDCLEERAYTILKDLDMVEPTLDFSI